MEPKTDREPLTADVIGIVVGLGFIAWSMVPANDIAYLPGDVRGQPWFHPLLASIAVVFGVLILSVASIRLLQGLHKRK